MFSKFVHTKLTSIRIIAILLGLSALTARAQKSATDEVRRLQARMYKLYASQDYDAFISVTDSLKTAAEKAGDERTFYKAWANQVLFSSNRGRRNRAMEIAREMQQHAINRGNKFGIYNGTHVAAYTHQQMENLPEAIKEYKKAIAYLHEYLPNESAASSLLELAKIAYLRSNPDKCISYAEQAIHEQNLNPLHRLNALSLMCIASADSAVYHPRSNDYRTDFNLFYSEREKAKKDYGRDDIYGMRVDIFKDILNRDFKEALKKAERIPTTLTRLEMQRTIYEKMGDHRNAYLMMKRYHWWRDSINEARNTHLLTEMTTAMNVGRLENEQKELKLRNQTLRLENLASELEQQRLQEEALSLSLKNKEVELQNASVRMQNDSLDKYNKDLQISEYQSKMAAKESAAETQRVFFTMAAILTGLIIATLAFTLWRRSQNARRLRRMNDQLTDANNNLKTAYDKLEETTAAKERIESELRIARDIQMGMVPSVFPAFPNRDDIDIYAVIDPAREVGGDLYDFMLQNDRLYFCIGDVSGKGIPASLFMSAVVNLFRMLAKEGFPPEYIATRLNETLTENNENGMFCTLFIGDIDLNTGKLHYCNAGHNPPVIMARQLNSNAPTEPTLLEMETNAPIGLWPDLEFVGEEIGNIKDRPLFFYTDGLSEAEDANQQQYGEERLLDILGGQPFDSARLTIERHTGQRQTACGQRPSER